jgi:hypothetical protein
MGATAFSGDDALRGSLASVRLVKRQAWVWDDLREACDIASSGAAGATPASASTPATKTARRTRVTRACG